MSDEVFRPNTDELLEYNEGYVKGFADHGLSLVLSQRLLGTQEIILIHHTDCGLQKVNPSTFKEEMQEECGLKPSWSIESFTDPFEDTRQSMNRLHHSPFLKYKNNIRGFVYDVADGRLIEVHR